MAVDDCRLTGEFALGMAANGLAVGRFAALDSIGGVAHAVTTRQGLDVGMVKTDRKYAADALTAALRLKEVAWLEQVHGGDIIQVRQGGPAGSADGMVTDVPGLGLIGRSADCPLILLADPVGGVVGMAHASWRGTVRQIAAQLVSVCVTNLRAQPARMIACICPSAGPCCYEVGPDVLKAAVKGIGPRAEAFFAERGGKLYFDLWAANADQLAQAGLPPANIHVARICTMCRNDLFPSHRLEGDRAGRFIAVIART